MQISVHIPSLTPEQQVQNLTEISGKMTNVKGIEIHFCVYFQYLNYNYSLLQQVSLAQLSGNWRSDG